MAQDTQKNAQEVARTMSKIQVCDQKTKCALLVINTLAVQQLVTSLRVEAHPVWG